MQSYEENESNSYECSVAKCFSVERKLMESYDTSIGFANVVTPHCDIAYLAK